jgi:hypothetical protein
MKDSKPSPARICVGTFQVRFVKIITRSFSAMLVLALLLATGCSAAGSLHRSNQAIRAALLKRTPLGTPEEEVEKFIVKEGWAAQRGDYKYLLPRAAKQGGGPAVFSQVKSVVTAGLGSYFVFFGTSDVSGLWGFDADGHLIDIWVHKEHDVL